ncbi:MAG: hypothetical protein IPL02_13200 [Moraxellaceae bacterium]|nr:hypothetical protein [Moraxellaceae bacterium]
MLSTAEPLRNSVDLSVQIQQGITPKSVTYYSDLFKLGTSTQAGSFVYGWSLASQTDGQHLLTAQIETAPNNYFFITKQVQVDNPNISLAAIKVSQSMSNLNIMTTATSDSNIKKVQLFIDNQLISTLTSPKVCTDNDYICSPNTYEWNLDLQQFGFGNHQIKIKAEDNAGEVAEKTTNYLVNAQPQLTIANPLDGQIVGSSLAISGTVIDDEANPLLVIKLRDLEIYRGTTQSFATTYDMSSLPLGSYTLTLSVTPKTGSTITKTIQVNYQGSILAEYLYSLGADGYMQDVSQNNVLFANANNVFLYDTVTTQQKLVTEKTKIDYLQIKQVIGNRVLLSGKDIILEQYQVYLWDNGTLKNISEISGENSLGYYAQEAPLMIGSWIVWSATSLQRYHLYNVDTQESHIIAKPSYSPYLGNNSYSLVVLADTVRFYAWTQTGGTGTSSLFDILQYDTKTNATTRLTNNGLQNYYPQASKTRIAWQQTPQGNTAPYSLVLASVDNPLNQQILSTVMKRFWLANDDLLVWEDAIGSQTAINANNGVSQYSLPASNISVVAVGDGKVVYNKNNTTWVWQPSKEPSQLFAFVIQQPKFDKATGMLYFTTGNENNLYRIKLP